jgi:thioredoxin reductase
LLCNIFAEKGKQVKVISKPRPEAAIPQDNVEWLDSQELTEIIGEGLELKAVKLSTGKAIGCSQVLFLGNYKPNTEFLKDTPVRLIEDYVWVDDKLQTSLENIFACGAVCRQDGFSGVGKSWDEAHREGVLAAENLINLLERGRIPCQPMS